MNQLDFDNLVPSRLLLSASGAGTSLSDSKEIQRSPFVVTSIRVAAFLAAASGGAVIGTALPALAHQTIGSNTLASAFSILAQLEISDTVIANAYTPLPLWGGYGDQDEILTEPWILPVKRNVAFKVQNGTGLNVTVALLLKGYKQLRG